MSARTPLSPWVGGLTQMMPMVLFTLPAGHVADNHDRQRIIVLMTAGDCLRQRGPNADLGSGRPGVLDLFLPVRGRHWRTFLWPASSAFLPHLVSRRTFPGQWLAAAAVSNSPPWLGLRRAGR